MTRIDIDLIDSKIHLTSWPRKLSLNAEEALRVYEVIGTWLGLNRPDYRDLPLNEEPYQASDFLST